MILITTYVSVVLQTSFVGAERVLLNEQSSVACY